MSHGSLREVYLENCQPDDNSIERVCPTKMGHNQKSVDEHSEENAVVASEVTSGKKIEVGESTHGIEHRLSTKVKTNVKICKRLADQKVPSGLSSDAEQTKNEERG